MMNKYRAHVLFAQVSSMVTICKTVVSLSEPQHCHWYRPPKYLYRCHSFSLATNSYIEKQPVVLLLLL